MFTKTYEITVMSYPEGNWILEYNSTIIPMVNDTIINDQDDEEKIHQEYIVIERQFSVSNQRVVILVKNNE